MRGKHRSFQRLLWRLVRRHNMFELVQRINEDGFSCTYPQVGFWSRGGGYAPPDIIPHLYRALLSVDVEDAMGLMHFVTEGTGLSLLPAPAGGGDERPVEWDVMDVGVALGKAQEHLLGALSAGELSPPEIAKAKTLLAKVVYEIRELEHKLDVIVQRQHAAVGRIRQSSHVQVSPPVKQHRRLADGSGHR